MDGWIAGARPKLKFQYFHFKSDYMKFKFPQRARARFQISTADKKYIKKRVCARGFFIFRFQISTTRASFIFKFPQRARVLFLNFHNAREFSDLNFHCINSFKIKFPLNKKFYY